MKSYLVEGTIHTMIIKPLLGLFHTVMTSVTFPLPSTTESENYCASLSVQTWRGGFRYK